MKEVDAFVRAFARHYDAAGLESALRVLRSALRRRALDDTRIQSIVTKTLLRMYAAWMKKTPRRHFVIKPREIPLIDARFRPMLADRIRGAVDLIRLNRDEQIEKELKRFAGWAAGANPARKPDPGLGKLKSLSRLPFEARRVSIDQGHKLLAAIDDVIAVENGAIARKWRHIHPHAGYQSRPEHIGRDGIVYSVRGSGVPKAGRPYVDELPDQPGELPYCRCWFEPVYSEEDLPMDMRDARQKTA